MPFTCHSAKLLAFFAQNDTAAWFHTKMAWKEHLNSMISRTLGLTIVRSETAHEIARLRRRQLPGPNWLPDDYESQFRSIWLKVRDRTMTAHEKMFALYHATKYIERYRIPGDIVECGVWRGGSMLMVARTLDALGSHGRDLYLFDTFEGMSEPTERDIHITGGRSAADLLAERPDTSKVWAKASLGDVREGFAEVAYPAERVHFIEGKVEDTIPQSAPQQIALLRLDTDWYASTAHEFKHLYDRLAPGGVLIVDDYGTWQGSRDATDEFLEQTGEPLLLVRAGRGRIAVKPGMPSHGYPA